MPFAQLVIGPPGAGKSTYCNGMQQFLGAIGRKSSIVNLDPANDHTSYTAAIDVRDLVTLEEIMKNDELGPNGGVLYALEELEANSEWLLDGLKSLGQDYVLFDCPGQVELFTHHYSLRKIIAKIEKMGYRVCAHPIVMLLKIDMRLTIVYVDGSRQSHRFLLPYPPFSVHLNPAAVPKDDAANGYDACQCPHQDR
jgi:GPN-loop GTPase